MSFKTFLLSIAWVLLLSTVLAAQPHNPPPPPEPVPIGGVGYLLFGGCAYGIYRVSKKRKR